MKTIPLINLISMLHLIFLAIWVGVLATEAVIELYPYKMRDLHNPAIRFHYWIDLLVELPAIFGLAITGIIMLILAEQITLLHVIKITIAVLVISVQLYCIFIVLKRAHVLKSGGSEEILWQESGTVIKSFVIGFPLGVIVALIGFWLGYHRMLDLISG